MIMLKSQFISTKCPLSLYSSSYLIPYFFNYKNFLPSKTIPKLGLYRKGKTYITVVCLKLRTEKNNNFSLSQMIMLKSQFISTKCPLSLYSSSYLIPYFFNYKNFLPSKTIPKLGLYRKGKTYITVVCLKLRTEKNNNFSSCSNF